MKRPAKSMVVLVVAVLAVSAWWFVRAPLILLPVAQAPDIDIDPPAMRARREAALALAMTPDNPWTFAESLTASAPAKPAQREDCGMQDGPRFGEPGSPEDAPVQVGGASPRFITAQARIDAALRASADPLDRAVADLVNAGDMRTASGRDEAVVQDAAVATDPRVYALGHGLCHSTRPPAPSCGALSLERWAALDVGNGIPWVDLLARAQARGDAAGVQGALTHLATATRFDTYLSAPAGAVASRLSKDDRDLAAVSDMTMTAHGLALTLPMPAFQPLIQLCRDQAGGDVELARKCRAISDVMFEHSDTLITQSISGALLFRLTGDASRRDLIRAERAVAVARWSPATGFSECRDLRDTMTRLLRSAQVGEVGALREQSRKFVTP
jgi:hypothetical protein